MAMRAVVELLHAPVVCLCHRLLYLSRFAVVQMSSASHRGSDGGLDSRGPFRAVDILADGLDADWTPAAHLRIMKVISRLLLLYLPSTRMWGWLSDMKRAPGTLESFLGYLVHRARAAASLQMTPNRSCVDGQSHCH